MTKARTGLIVALDGPGSSGKSSVGAAAALEDVLSSRSVDVLIVNRQTEGAVPGQLRKAAERAGVPVVEVTETVAPGSAGFADWQVDQLRRLASALGVT